MALKGWEGVTPAQAAGLGRKSIPMRPFLDESPIAAPVSKYRSQRTKVDGISFMSKAEAARYSHLKLLEKLQQIRDLRLQPRFTLHVNSQKVGVVIFDFAYLTGVLNERVIEDVKGYDPTTGSGVLSRWKRRHFEIEYGVTVQVIRK